MTTNDIYLLFNYFLIVLYSEVYIISVELILLLLQHKVLINHYLKVSREEIMKVFTKLLSNQTDISIDFKNAVFVKDDERHIYSYGVEHSE